MTHPPQQPQQPPQGNIQQAPVQPQPTPFTPIFGRVMASNGQEIIMMQLHMLTGTVVVFMPPEGATAMGEELLSQGRSVASGLILPPGARLGTPPPHTNNGHKEGPTTDV